MFLYKLLPRSLLQSSIALGFVGSLFVSSVYMHRSMSIKKPQNGDVSRCGTFKVCFLQNTFGVQYFIMLRFRTASTTFQNS